MSLGFFDDADARRRFLEAAVDRNRLEVEVQNLLGPIDNIGEFSIAELYGMRDRAKRKVLPL